MVSLSLSHIIDAEDVAHAMAGFDEADMKAFCGELVDELSRQDENSVFAFADAIEGAFADFRAGTEGKP